MAWRPLAGTRVLDLSRLLPGPFLSQILADLGADVVKVEQPGVGDSARAMGPAFDAINKGKRSVALDLKTEEGRALALRLAAKSDVLLESFRPGVMDRLGLDDETLARANPRLVRVSLVGYPPGPRRDEPGHDLNYEALAGLLQGDPPQAPAIPVADLGGALYGAVGVLAALLERERTGRGRRVEVALLDAARALGSIPLVEGLARGLPGYRAYRCADGRFLALAALEPKFWERFVAAVGRSDLADLHLDPAGVAVVERVMLERPRDAWVDLLVEAGVPASPVLTPEEALAHEAGPSFPLTRTRSVGRAPALGEHTDEVLRE